MICLKGNIIPHLVLKTCKTNIMHFSEEHSTVELLSTSSLLEVSWFYSFVLPHSLSLLQLHPLFESFCQYRLADLHCHFHSNLVSKAQDWHKSDQPEGG